MAGVEALDDDRDTALPPSALSPAEYRGFRALVNDLDHTGDNHQVSLYSVLEFLASFSGVTHTVAGKIVDIVLDGNQTQFVDEGHIYAMIRLTGHWQTDKRIEKSLIFVQDHEIPSASTSTSTVPPPTSALNPFRANSLLSSTATRTGDVDRGVEAFKRLMLDNKAERSSSEPPDLATPPSKAEETASLHSSRTEQSTTGMTFIYTSDEEEEDVGSAVKHSPEKLVRESPQPMITPPSPGEKKLLPPLLIPSQQGRPAPPPSRKRGASGSNQNNIINSEERKSEEKSSVRRSLPPAPPAPRRSPSTASNRTIERSASFRKEPPPPLPVPTDLPSISPAPPPPGTGIKPPPPRPRRKLSDTSVTSFDTTPSRSETAPVPRSDPETSPQPPPQAAASKRISIPPPPPPPPRHSNRKLPAPNNPSSPTRRSTEIPILSPNASIGDSPRRSSAPDQPNRPIEVPDSELSLELGKLQREVDELVFGLTKKRGKREKES